MSDDEKNETGRSVHQSVRTLEEAHALRPSSAASQTQSGAAPEAGDRSKAQAVSPKRPTLMETLEELVPGLARRPEPQAVSPERPAAGETEASSSHFVGEPKPARAEGPAQPIPWQDGPLVEFSDVVWHPDPAASGHRERAYIRHATPGHPNVQHLQLIAYSDGRTILRENGEPIYQGRGGKRALFDVYTSLYVVPRGRQVQVGALVRDSLGRAWRVQRVTDGVAWSEPMDGSRYSDAIRNLTLLPIGGEVPANAEATIFAAVYAASLHAASTTGPEVRGGDPSADAWAAVAEWRSRRAGEP